MILIKTVKKSSLVIFACVLAVIILASVLLSFTPFSAESELTFIDSKWYSVLGAFFDARNLCLCKGESDTLKSMYVTAEQNGKWAFESEVKRAQYLKNWAERQGVTFTSIVSKFDIKRAKQVGRGYAFYVVVSTEYKYAYNDAPDTLNMFRIGTYHTMDLIPGKTADSWVISREWYLDPFQDSLKLNNLKTEEINTYINSQTARDFSALSQRRKNAVAYADRYCGAAADEEYGYKYNNKYFDYNGAGGDCTNFISQVLHEGGGFKKTGAWNYSGGAVSRAWGNAQGFKDYMLYSGRGSLIARGTFSQVYKSAYKLQPGDIISYEENGKVVHNGIVTCTDSKGYPMVDTHTTDRYHVPWDMGWNDSDIKFWLIRVHY